MEVKQKHSSARIQFLAPWS